MSALVAAVKAHLEADATLMAALTGLVWDRPISRESGMQTDPVTSLTFSARSTPEAFNPDPPYALRPCVSVKALNETRYPGGPFRAYAEYVQVWCYTTVADDAAGVMQTVRRRVRDALDRVTVPTTNGSGVLQPAFDATAPQPAPEFPDAVVAVETFLAAGIRQMTGAHT